ncbi:DUF3311 domain-containing protein [Oceanobacillus kimchii]|uniref:DUF3311 domain-containing protein n=2 Tax=Oceanobacillus TaxID=182709 RepID=UPI00036DB44E|nr:MULTISPECIES: DUF3311 domain-containing protein [Oceanobacillus]MCT1578398.1 DUF3311 domain-containing protein [Oceanobacillus kimchii]MCT2134576.1 DUF3311 domain-containing protein [Oceanobacillus kimchii]OEH54811.1 hypothetical protein AQ616_07115 [Oceanobacillus sp. E9]
MQIFKSKYVYHLCTIFGLIMLESPIILAANRVEPMIFGFPFLISWVLFWWLFCCVVLYIAYRTNWGKNKE